MASYEDSYKSQLQGVSQQVARERLDGQVSAQDNMLSDIVTNLRRRPGAEYAYHLMMPGATTDSIVALDTDLAGNKCHIILNIVDGVIRILNHSTYAVLATLPASSYLMAAKVADIQVTTVGDELFVANLTKKPALVAATAVGTPAKRGMFYIKAGAFSKTYEVRVQTSIGSVVATYTTPNGTGAGDAALAAPEYIASQLLASISSTGGTHGVSPYRDASYVYLDCSAHATATDLAVNTPSGSTYVIASGSSYVRNEADLPGRLPSQGNGYIISTGEVKFLKYYKYDHAKMAWLESGNFESPTGISNMPVSVAYADGAWVLKTAAYEGRFAGDDETNPAPEFVSRGITGISSYQGRLVVLAGPMITMSGSNKPRRFYRSTVTAVADNDRIEVGASAASAAAYRHAVPFHKDLLLFSDKYQALIAGGNAAITPRTASVVVTSTYEADTLARPIPLGRTLMYSAPRSADFFGIMEMVPSTQTESQYVSNDSTGHLPKYMAGRCRFSVSSSVANMVLFAPSKDKSALIVHEYVWVDEKKVQQAWHRWSFRYEVATAYFSGDKVIVMFVNNGVLVACTIDPRQGVLTAAAERRPFLDMSVFADVVNRQVQAPAWYTTFDPACLPFLKLSIASGPLAGEEVGFTAAGASMTTVVSFPAGRVAIGFPYRSTFSPTQPMMKDENDVKISSNKLTVLRFLVGTNNSSQYEVSVSDAASSLDQGDVVGTLTFSSSELALGKARVGNDNVSVIPCRTAADTTSLVLFTEGTGELNVVSLEFVARYHEKIKRRR